MQLGRGIIHNEIFLFGDMVSVLVEQFVKLFAV